MVKAEPVQVIIDLLKDNWNDENTNYITPKIDKIYNYKRIDFRAYKSYILCYELPPAKEVANGIGTSTKETEYIVVMNIQTMESDSHARKLLQEVTRILENNMINPHSDYQLLDPDDSNIQNRHDKTTGLFKFIRQCKLINTNEQRGVF